MKKGHTLINKCQNFLSPDINNPMGSYWAAWADRQLLKGIAESEVIKNYEKVT